MSGKLQLDQWQDKNTGENRSRHTMIVDGFDFVSGQGNTQQGQPMQGQQPMQQQPAQQMNPNQAAQQAQQPMPQQAQQSNSLDDDDVPF